MSRKRKTRGLRRRTSRARVRKGAALRRALVEQPGVKSSSEIAAGLVGRFNRKLAAALLDYVCRIRGVVFVQRACADYMKRVRRLVATGKWSHDAAMEAAALEFAPRKADQRAIDFNGLVDADTEYRKVLSGIRQLWRDSAHDTPRDRKRRVDYLIDLAPSLNPKRAATLAQRKPSDAAWAVVDGHLCLGAGGAGVRRQVLALRKLRADLETT